MRRHRHPTFVPRAILNTALVAVVPAIASCASRRQALGVAATGFVATGGSAEPDAASAAPDASENPSNTQVIDAGATPPASDAGALVPNQITPPPPLPVAYQGFEINESTVAQQAFETERVSRDHATADGGTRTRRRR